MGGNALKQATTRRYYAGEYFDLEHEVQQRLASLLNVRVLTIPAYRRKESFGDMDLLVESNDLGPQWKQQVIDCFKPTETYSNGNVFTFDYKELQIDLIVEQRNDIDASRNYFAYNDLGNLMGRIAHSMGMRLGHRGLSYEWREPGSTTIVHDKRLLTQDWKDVCWLLGLDYNLFNRGFDTLEEIFEFVASSMFFSPRIYLLESRNHVSRVRDAKRKTYMAFLQWCEDNKARLKDRSKVTPEWVVQYLTDQVSSFARLDAEVWAGVKQSKDFKERFNGTLVSKITGLTTQELGNLMRWIKDKHPNLQEKVLNLNPVVVPRWIEFQFEEYKKEQS